VASHSLDTKSVLDIGCCNGEHLAHFGPGSTGVTISAEEAKEGSARGLDVRVGNVEEHLPIEKSYEVVYANNILEHLYSAHRFLYDIRESLHPDGVLILGVPVFPYPHFLMKARKFRGALADAHINFYTRKTLITTVRAAGWHILEARTYRIGIPFIDTLLADISPHIYIIATPDTSFAYSEKRKKELAGYA
jgi:SAM-dependent methyltransferase